jgi:hypothetical protein
MSVTNTTPNSRRIEKQYKSSCCDGFGCSETATEKVSVSAGTFGVIILSLCPLCKNKFSREFEDGN